MDKANLGRRYFKRRREPIENRRPIHERPKAVENRQEFGHWEQFRTQHGNLMTLCERKSRFVITAPLNTKTAAQTGEVLLRIFSNLPERVRRTITFDNGGAFAGHETLSSETGIQVFFCDPHAPWQRSASLGNAVPSRTQTASFGATCPGKPTSPITAAPTSKHRHRRTDMAINSTPKKCLGFKTPAEAFIENINVALEM
jgi:IS30 family transposase